MKLKKAIGVLMCLVLACFAFIGCESKNAKYTVTVTASIDATTNETMGTVAVDPAQSTHKKNSTVTIKATSKPGYEFVNWTDENGEVIKIGDFPATETYSFKITSNRVFLANFKKIIKATFNLNGGAVLGTGATTINQNDNVAIGDLSLSVLTKKGYIFNGWRLNNGATISVPQTGDYVYNVTEQNTTDLNFEAMFTAKTYAPILKISGSDNNINSDNSYILTYDQPMPELPKCADETKAYLWKRGGEPVAYTTWAEDVEDVSSLIFEADVLNAKAFLFEVDGKAYPAYKIVENEDVKTIADVLPSGAVEKTGYEFKGFVLKGGDTSKVYKRIKYSLTDEEKDLPENADILTENLISGGTEKAIYEALFEIKSFSLTFDGANRADVVAGEGYSSTVQYNKNVQFTISPIKQSESGDKTFKITRVYLSYDGKEVDLTANEGVYSFNMPASNATIKVDAVAVYMVNFYSNRSPVGTSVEIEEGATTINVPEIEDEITGEFIGWTLNSNENRQDISFNGTINNPTEFWNFVNAQENKYSIDLYAIWYKNENGLVKIIGNKNTYGTDYVIVPAVDSVGTLYNLKCNDQMSLYSLLEQINKNANADLNITKTYESLSTDEKLTVLYYNISKCLDTNCQIWSSSVTYEDEFYLIKSEADTLTKNATVSLEVNIKDALGNSYSNVGGVIDKETLQSIKANGVTITFSLSNITIRA